MTTGSGSAGRSGAAVTDAVAGVRHVQVRGESDAVPHRDQHVADETDALAGAETPARRAPARLRPGSSPGRAPASVAAGSAGRAGRP